MKIINIDKLGACDGRGASGSYYNLGNGTGIKMIRCGHYELNGVPFRDGNVRHEPGTKFFEGYSSIYYLQQSSEWLRAYQELMVIKTAEFTGMTPKGYEIVIIEKITENSSEMGYERDKRYYPGIVMEHIDGKQLADYVDPKDAQSNEEYIRDKRIKIKQTIEFMLNLMNFRVGDAHEWNIIVTAQGKPVMIDLEPAYTHLYGWSPPPEVPVMIEETFEEIQVERTKNVNA